MAICLTQEQIEQIYQHGCVSYPFECCGIILGSINYETSEPEKIAVELIPTENVWNAENAVIFGENGENSPRRRYAIAPQVMLNTQKNARDRSLDIIGIYHSHPDYSAIPSEFDRRYAWSGYSYIIVAITNSDVNFYQSLMKVCKQPNNKIVHSYPLLPIFSEKSGVFPHTINIHSWCLDENQQFHPEPIIIK
ncbi:Mov34/MPN/PAD-1 family protein [Calothrix sp. NIES-3974]|uniref:Mov34/MPN/PAD-1 family protein n=1 Tax=Calothrix sp. NIES-3974 TaxID=2005462 RepID=UPI000BBCCED3|nr:M67 family metallopeptidase [Calothrix sp. NIES-3974]